jgi:purine-binding chemotaxis protein CheW
MTTLKKTENTMQRHLLNTSQNDALLTLTFRIGTQYYGLPVSVVVEIVRIPALIPLAGAPPAVIGLLNLRGRYLPVVDGSILIGEPPDYGINNQIIIAGKINNHTILPLLGLRVDQVFDVSTLSLNQFTPFNHSIAASFLKGIIESGKTSVLLFDLDALLTLIPQDITNYDGTTEDTAHYE